MPSLVQKMLAPQPAWEKDELLDGIYWLRQVLAVVLGIIWGVLPLQGIVGLLLYIAASSSWVYLFYNIHQKVSIEELETTDMDLLSEGFKESFAGFLVFWILTYSIVGV